MSSESCGLKEENEILIGKIATLEKNIQTRNSRFQKDIETLAQEKIALQVKQESSRNEIYFLKEELRIAKAKLVGTKRPKLEVDSSKASSLPITWILSRVNGTMEVDLKKITVAKLREFGKFFKNEFDQLYSPEILLQEINLRVPPRDLLKTLVYLSDRPEIVSRILGYIFKKHIILNGEEYIKDVTRIIYKIGLVSILGNTDVINDLKKYFTKCYKSIDLLNLIETLSEKYPRGTTTLLSEEYLISISRLFPERALRIINTLENNQCTIPSSTSLRVIYSLPQPNTHPYTCPNTNLVFFLER
ncbi:hypothetical protein NEOKW01_1576 [Nematocida sp. AWRm80]|nr:hypothetical protein NEOKW01_1576 [Nematocida sp. AWRm80]